MKCGLYLGMYLGNYNMRILATAQPMVRITPRTLGWTAIDRAAYIGKAITQEVHHGRHL